MEKNLAEEFRKIIDNMSDEELNQKLRELKPLHNVGPKADEYLEFLEENKQKFKKGDFLKELSLEKQKELYAGGMTGSLWSAIYRSVNVFTDLGRYLGSSIRRFSERKFCNY